MLISNYQWLKGQRTLLQCHTQYSSQVSSFYSPRFSLSTLFWQQLGVFSFISKIFLHFVFSSVHPLSAREKWPLTSSAKLDSPSCHSWKIIFMILWGSHFFLRDFSNMSRLFFHCNTESLLKSSSLFGTLCKGKHIKIPGMMVHQRLEIAQSSFWWHSGLFSTMVCSWKVNVRQLIGSYQHWAPLRVYCAFEIYIFSLSFPKWSELFTLCASASWCITFTPPLSLSCLCLKGGGSKARTTQPASKKGFSGGGILIQT